MRVVIFGATGMVGAGALLECLDEPRVDAVLVVTRRTTGVVHAKLTERLHQDYYHYDALLADFATCAACFFCLGVSSMRMDEAAYHHLTYDLTLAAAEAMSGANPGMIFLYVSGAGTDSTEKGRAMWARVKGKTENALLRLPFASAYMLRPWFIQPMRGVRSSTGWYNTMYDFTRSIYPLIQKIIPKWCTNTAVLGRAMIRLAHENGSSTIVESTDINRLGAVG